MMKPFHLTSAELVNLATCPNFNGLVVHGHIRAEERAIGGFRLRAPFLSYHIRNL